MSAELEALRALLPEPAKDLKLNLQTVLTPTHLSTQQTWGVAIAAAIASRHVALRDALIASRPPEVGSAVVEDAYAAASLMGMNNIYYRFRHLVAKPSYAEMPARLRMNRLAKPATNKVDFELYSLAVSAIGACETCVQAHERVVLEGGLTEAHVQDAVRITATVYGAAVALEGADVLQKSTTESTAISP